MGMEVPDIELIHMNEAGNLADCILRFGSQISLHCDHHQRQPWV